MQWARAGETGDAPWAWGPWFGKGCRVPAPASSPRAVRCQEVRPSNTRALRHPQPWGQSPLCLLRAPQAPAPLSVPLRLASTQPRGCEVEKLRKRQPRRGVELRTVQAKEGARSGRPPTAARGHVVVSSGPQRLSRGGATLQSGLRGRPLGGWQPTHITGSPRAGSWPRAPPGRGRSRLGDAALGTTDRSPRTPLPRAAPQGTVVGSRDHPDRGPAPRASLATAALKLRVTRQGRTEVTIPPPSCSGAGVRKAQVCRAQACALPVRESARGGDRAHRPRARGSTSRPAAQETLAVLETESQA